MFGSPFCFASRVLSLSMNATQFITIAPVLPTSDMQRDIAWYQEKLGLTVHHADDIYAVLYRENIVIHLQWHADTADDPLLGGSVFRIFVKNIQPFFEELIQRGAVTRDKFITGTAWNTNEFGFYDLNKNAIFVVEDVTR